MLDLIAVRHGLDAQRDFRAVAAIAAEIAGLHGLDLDSGDRELGAKPESAPAPPRSYPSVTQVDELLSKCLPVDQDTEVAALLASRGLDATAVAVRDLAYALPPTVAVPAWARFRGREWTETGHRLIVPMYDHTCTLRSVRAWRVVPGSTPARLPPAGHRAGGLVMLDTMGREAFRAGGWPEWNRNAPAFVVAEGEPDWLTWAIYTAVGAGGPEHACIGIVNGSWSPEIAAAIPDGARVVIWTDRDRAGDRYRIQIADSLRGRCTVSEA